MIDQALNFAALFLSALAVFVFLSAFLTRRRGWAASRRQVLIGAVALSATVAIEVRWNRRHEAFHELGPRLHDRHGACPAAPVSEPELASVARRVTIELDAGRREIAWRGYSLRRREVYDCQTGEFSLK